MKEARRPRKPEPPTGARVGLHVGPRASRGSGIDAMVLDTLRRNAAELTHALLLADEAQLLAENPLDTALPPAAPLTIETLNWAALEGDPPAVDAAPRTPLTPQHADAEALAGALAALAPGAPALTQPLDAEGLARWTARLQKGDAACEHLLRLLRGLDTRG